MRDGKIDFGNCFAYYLNDKLHREDGPAREWNDGSKEWLINGLPHREGGPAIEWEDTGAKRWYRNGHLHREDGPAVINYNNCYWYYDGKYIDCNSQEEYERIIKLKAFW